MLLDCFLLLPAFLWFSALCISTETECATSDLKHLRNTLDTPLTYQVAADSASARAESPRSPASPVSELEEYRRRCVALEERVQELAQRLTEQAGPRPSPRKRETLYIVI